MIEKTEVQNVSISDGELNEAIHTQIYQQKKTKCKCDCKGAPISKLFADWLKHRNTVPDWLGLPGLVFPNSLPKK